MLTSGDVADVDFGLPRGREAGFKRPAIIVTAQRLLDRSPSVVQVVPLTTTIRGFGSEVGVEPSLDNGLDHPSAAQCAQIRSVSAGQVSGVKGNVGTVVLTQVRQAIAVTLGIGP